MNKQPSREELMQRIAALEKAARPRPQTVDRGAVGANLFDLKDLMNAADGICVCHPIQDPPHVLFTFWNRRMVDLTGYALEEINAKGWYQSVYPDPEVQIRAKARMGMMREGINLEAEEWEITRADGEKRTLRISTSLLGPGGGKPSVLAIMQDVSALRQSERLLRKEHQALKRELERRTTQLTDIDRTLKASDSRYRALFERATDAIFIENENDEILDVNPKACALLGYTREELIGMSVPDIQAPECRGEKGRVLRGELDDHQGKPFEVFDLHKDGTRIPVEVTNNRLDEKGLFLSIVRDIRERRAAEETRREAYHILEKSPVVAFLWRNAANWPVEFVTSNVARVLGYSAEDFISGRTAYGNVVHPDDLDRVAQEMGAISQDPDRIEFTHRPYRVLTKDGGVRWVDDHKVIRRDSAGRIIYYHGIVQDRTEHVFASEELQQAKRQQAAILENIPDIAWLKDRDRRFIAVNDTFARACGWAAAELVGQNDLDIWPREMAEMYRADDAEVMRTGQRKTVEEPLSDISGQVKWIETIKTPIFDDQGNLMGTTGIARDITQRRQLEQDLITEKERMVVTLRSIGDAVITTDSEGRIALMNPIAETLTGWQEAEAVGRPLMEVFQIVNEKTRQSCANPVDKVLQSGQIVGLANHTLLIARDGREYFIADSGAPILDAHRTIVGVILVFRDITERQAMQRELLKMEKLQSLGVLAGGIAHDFNNFLTGIIGNLSLAKLDLQTGNPVDGALDEMEKAALRAKDLTQQLLTFSKGGDPVKRTADIADIVREAAQFALRGSNVRCDVALEADLHLSEVDGGQIAQVLHNLIINADQAMPGGGTITLHGENTALPPDNAYALPAGDYIRLAVQDRGVGIRADHLKKVFDPYFTTKQKGSGLGLAVAYSVVTKHDGQLTVESQLGEGTTFTVLLPASDGPREKVADQEHGVAGGSGVVLVMDDEDFIRDLAARMLTKMGYRVSVAANGQEALDLYRQAQADGEPFDAVILDLTVPGAMGGKEAIEHLIDLDPGVRAIVSSGYANDPIMSNHQDYGFSGAVRKPYQMQDLSEVLKRVMKS